MDFKSHEKKAQKNSLKREDARWYKTHLACIMKKFF